MQHYWRFVGVLFVILFGVSFYLWQTAAEAKLAGGANLAAVSNFVPETKPKLINGAGQLDLSARAFLSAYLSPAGSLEILTEKGADERLPIASVTKLMTALVVAENLNLEQEVTITPEGIVDQGDRGGLKVGDQFYVTDLLFPLLVESSNNAATVLASVMGEREFVVLMNQTTARLQLDNTSFVNPSGLDPISGDVNYSTAHDLLTLAEFILKNEPEIFSISTLPVHDLYQSSGRLHHRLKNTNELITNNGWPARVVGSKTGQTDLAGKNLLFVLQDDETGGYLINIVLRSTDHFGDMRQLIGWVYNSYSFSLIK